SSCLLTLSTSSPTTSTTTVTREMYSLSLHDALPIWEVDDRSHHAVAGHRLAQQQRDQQRHHGAERHLRDREVQGVAGGDPEDRIGQSGGVGRQTHEGGRADEVVLVEAEDESERERDEGDQDDSEQPGRGQADTGAGLGPL